MKTNLLAASAIIAIVASGMTAHAQENKDHAPSAERMEPRTPAAPRAAEPERQSQPRAAQAEERNRVEPQRNEQPRAAQTEERNRVEPQRNDQPKAAQTEERNRVGQKEQNGASGSQREEKRVAEPRGQPRVIGKVGTSQEHAVRVGELLHRNSRPERVDFGIEVGARVPESVVIYPLPAEVLGFAPEYRGYDYFVDSDDEIVFVSPETHEIVGAIDYEGRAAAEDSSVNVAGARPCPIEN